jgi:hypothetical protein
MVTLGLTLMMALYTYIIRILIVLSGFNLVIRSNLLRCGGRDVLWQLIFLIVLVTEILIVLVVLLGLGMLLRVFGKLRLCRDLKDLKGRRDLRDYKAQPGQLILKTIMLLLR